MFISCLLVYSKITQIRVRNYTVFRYVLHFSIRGKKRKLNSLYRNRLFWLPVVVDIFWKLLKAMEGKEKRRRTESPANSSESIKSPGSMYEPPGFSEGKEKRRRTASPEPSCVSMKSTRSMYEPPGFSDGAVPFDPR